MRRLAAVTLATILAASACGGGEYDPTTTTATPSRESAGGAAGTTAAPEPIVPEALAFSAEQVGGGTFAGADLAGGDVVFWFWAPWCPTCAAAAAEVQAVADAANGVTFVGVGGLSSDVTSMERFVADHGVSGLTHIADATGEVYTRFGVIQQHTFAFVSADGTVETVPAYGRDVDLATLVDDAFD